MDFFFSFPSSSSSASSSSSSFFFFFSFSCFFPLPDLELLDDAAEPVVEGLAGRGAALEAGLQRCVGSGGRVPRPQRHGGPGHVH